MKNKFQYLHNSKLIAENILELDFKINDIAYVLEDNTGKTTFSLSCPIYNIRTNPTPTFGMWWWFPLTGK